jgi:hypothetical protein
MRASDLTIALTVYSPSLVTVLATLYGVSNGSFEAVIRMSIDAVTVRGCRQLTSMHSLFRSRAFSFRPPTSIWWFPFVSQSIQIVACLSTYVVHPSLALLGQVPCSNRDDGVVVLKVVGKVTEKVDESGMTSNRRVSSVFLRIRHETP